MSFVSLAQTDPVNGFTIKDKNLIYQHVFDTDLSAEDLKNTIRKSLKFNIETEEESIISGQIGKIEPKSYAREIGYTWSNIPQFIDRNYLLGNIDIQMKEGRYRVTISDIVLEKSITDKSGPFGSEKGTISPLEELGLNSSKEKMIKSFIKHTSKIYDYTFRKVFDFQPEKVVLDDNF